ncbi:aryl-sulfate sulfotransferase [Frigoriflavimonas asaccharolytica]|uniref:Secretion system C-terminal sorting domain-containing protein n=1 Tax=Frigoriflavimonas asaccharolytica TaxID=2735899 RepID=A0A8J8GAL1_9FLAO|nr:aryl-sulfate sulfotransferase [Frigoriflavimonas asaccharolytica]NRS92107.1 hypothetical protein [Frigoriflavimonas asaccharolytica]
MKYLFFLLFVNVCNAQTVGLIQKDAGSLDDGYVLFSPISSTTSYLIDKCGRQINTWQSANRPALSAYLLQDGTLLRSGNSNNTTFTAGGKGGIIQKIDWNGNVTWNYTISSALECQHHDVRALPNGNILAIVWESKTNTEAISQGRNPSLIPATIWSEKIIEIQQTGPTTGNIVWEWHVWDHLIQDFDTTKPNFGTISSNPQLLNLNFGASATNQDWIHLNSIDYNEELNQILVSAHEFDEVWIIDHSTTTAQAASHSGGNSGKGGDVLYRWGNPRAYNNGTVANQKLFGQHDAGWIKAGNPFANQIMIFNNGNGRTGGNYSTVEIINPPVNGANYTATLPYLPTSNSYIYNAGNAHNLYSQNISGAQQLSNGNVLISDGPAGNFFEVNTSGNTIWKYVNPVSNAGITTQGAIPSLNSVFKSTFYPSSYSGFAGKILSTGTIIENQNTLSANCNLTLNVEPTIFLENISIYPNPASDFIKVKLNSFESASIEIYNVAGQKMYAYIISSREIDISTKDFPNGVYFLKFINKKGITNFKLIIKH